MNKLLLILMAICLVSVHAYVKRDAPEPAANENYLKDVQDKMKELTEKFEETMKKSVNPEEIKKKFNEMIDNVSKAFNTDKAPVAA